jgi:hypothetical protein
MPRMKRGAAHAASAGRAACVVPSFPSAPH